ncbi:Nesprin-1, partial [Gryllus bimaculatus]
MIQSVTSKAEDLLQAQPASEISSKYETLSKQAKELYAKQKETVEQHQAFIDAGNDFMQWIRASKEKLSKCSEPTGDKESLSSKVTQLKVLQSAQDEGQQKLEKALEQGNVACQVADEEDKEVIEEEVALLQEEFDTYIESLNRTKSLLEVGIVKWTEYEDHYQEASDWLTQTEQLVQTFNKLQDSLEEKKNVLEEFQAHLQTLFDWQKELDRLNMKAQVLLETCADSRISNAVTQMTTKYNALLSLAKEIMRRLELHYQEHQQHSTLYQECQDWVDRTRDKLHECQEIPNTLTDVNNKVATVKGIRQSLEQGQNKLRYVLELKEKVILNTEQNGAAKIQEDTENLKIEFEKLMVDVQDLRQKLAAQATHLEDIHKAQKLLLDWLDEVEQKIQPDEISEKRAVLEKFRNVQRDINCHSEMVDRLKSRVSEEQFVPTKEYNSCLERYQKLKDLVAQNILTLEQQVNKQELQKQAYNDALDWLRKTRIEIQQCSDPHGEKETIQKKEEKMLDIKKTFPDGERLVEHASELSATVMSSVGAEAQDALRQDIQQLKTDWQSLQVMSKETEKMLSKCIAVWNDFTNTFNSMKDWLGEFQAKVAAENEEEKKTPDELQKCRALLQEAIQQKVVMEGLNDRCETLMELSACSWVRDQTVQLQGLYTNLLTSIQVLVSRAEKNLSDHTEFLKAKEEVDSWLKRAHGTVQDCIGVGNETVTRDKLETIQLVSTRMTEGQHLMSVMQDVFAKAINTAPADHQDNLREDMTQLRNSWDQLNMDLTSVMAQLKAALSRWEEYNEQKSQLETWMSNMEETLKETPDTKGELGEMKTLIERFKHLQAEVNSKKGDLDHLLSEAAELAVWASQPTVLEEVQKLQSRWDNLSRRCVTCQEALELEIGEYTAYHNSLQNTEKWILQTSFTLMAHNSLYITNKQQTLEQIQQHEALLEDIQKYQAVLDDIRAKGHGQIKRYVSSTPSIQETIEKQLNNVQDSYNSLLHTAIQIKKRLMESLAKFQEYEETLESIKKNLDVYEQLITKDFQPPVGNLALTHQLLEETRELHNKLQAEKSRLAVAVQACEAAAACISRPSSPQDTMPPPIPDSELLVRARLEDFIDQVQSQMSALTNLVSELEEGQRYCEALQKWIVEQQAIVQDWGSRPLKLRPEAAVAEQQAMKDLESAIKERQQKLRNELPAGENTSNLLEELNQLENKLTAVRGKKDTGQQTIEEFRQKINDIHSFLDTLSKRIEELDRGNGLDCAQKISALADIEKIFNNEASPKVEEVKQLGLKVMDITSNLDAQQVEEQLKSVERRYNDIAKRIQRKSQVLKLTHKGLEGARQEIESARTWILEKMALVQAPPPLGFESKAAEDRQQALKSLVKEVEGKKVLLETLEKRLNNMQAELEPNEQQVLESQLLSLTSDHSNLLAALKAEQEHVAAATDARRKLEADIEAARNWLKAKNGEFKKLGGYVPLRVSAIEAEYQLLKQFENEIKAFHMNNLNEIIKQVNAIEKDCTEPEKQKLKNNLQELLKEYETLNNTVNQKTESLLDLLNSRKQFEGEVNKIKHWLNEAEVATSAEIRVSNMGLLEEQLAKYDKLHKEAENIQGNIDNVILQAKNILLYVSEADKLTLSEEINAMKDKHARITGIIYDRSDALQGQLKQYKDAAAKISESVQFMTEIQKELKDLNRPISSKIEDVQGMLESYEKILADLKANKLKLGHLQVGNVSELQGITQQQDDLIQAIEAQIARLRQLLLLREQFIALITEIMTFITKYTEVVRDIEKEGHTVEEKIRKYDDVIVKIQECEALLASATDKGQQIAAEGSVSDRNSITEQLQSLKQSLQALRRAVEKQREQHEMTVAEHKKLAAELEEVLDWLHANEAAVRSRPLLDRDPTSVNVEIDKHKELATQVNSYLDRIRAVQDSVRHDDGMPGSLLEKLSEANSLLNTLPAELEERGKYLEMNKTLRVEYAALKDRLHNWVRDAEVHLNSNSEGIDFENIVQELEEHKVFFGSEASMKELVSQHIQQAADRIWPSLSAPEQEELSQEQQQLTQSLKNTLNLARSKQALLEQNIEVWRDYCHALDKVQAILSRSQFSDEPGCTLAGLQFSIQKINHALTDIQNQQNEIDLLNDHAKEIKQQADKNNAEKIDSQVKNMNTRWTECITGLETRRDNLQTLSVDWEEFEKNLQNFETLLFSYEEKTRHVDTVVRSKAQITEVKQSLQGLLSEIQDCSSLHDNILSLSVPVIEYLKTTSESAAQSLQEKLNNTSSSYQQLKKTVQNKLSKANEDLEKLTQVQANISKLQGELNPLHSKIQTFDEYGGDWETIEKSLQELVSQVKQAVGSSKDFITQTKEQYTSYQQSTPSDIVQEMSTLELLAETVSNAMDEKERQINRVHSLRSDYNKDTAEVSEWLPLAESRVKDRSVEPQIMKDSLSQIQSELCAIGEKLERLTRNGNLILEKTQNEGERNLIQNTISSLTEQYSQIKSLLDERKQQVGNALDAWQNFEALYNTVQAWVAEKQTFLAEPFQLSSLTQARQRLQEYTSAVKSCKVATKQVQDMTKALELIGQVASLGDLSEKLDEVTEAKGDVESQLLERNALLQETSEEWEQCEKKMKDVKSWIEKSRQSLDSPLYKKKPLRDQLTMREKMIGDMAIQKKKITISVEKLKVHFRSGVGGDTKVTEATEEILQELDQLLRSVKEQSVQLEACLAQLDQYQQEIQQLRQQIVQVEQQLRVVLSPTYSPHDRDKALEEQTGWQQDVNTYRKRIQVLTKSIHEMDPYYLVVCEKTTDQEDKEPHIQRIIKSEVLSQKPLNTTDSSLKTEQHVLYPGSVSYADVAAGRTSPCAFDKNKDYYCPLPTSQIPKSDFSTIHFSNNNESFDSLHPKKGPSSLGEGEKRDSLIDNASVSEIPVTCAVEIIEPQIGTPIALHKTYHPWPKSEQNNQNSLESEVLSQAMERQFLETESFHCQQQRHVWVPGSLTYADILRGRHGSSSDLSDNQRLTADSLEIIDKCMDQSREIKQSNHYDLAVSDGMPSSLPSQPFLPSIVSILSSAEHPISVDDVNKTQHFQEKAHFKPEVGVNMYESVHQQSSLTPDLIGLIPSGEDFLRSSHEVYESSVHQYPEESSETLVPTEPSHNNKTVILSEMKPDTKLYISQQNTAQQPETFWKNEPFLESSHEQNAEPSTVAVDPSFSSHQSDKETIECFSVTGNEESDKVPSSTMPKGFLDAYQNDTTKVHHLSYAQILAHGLHNKHLSNPPTSHYSSDGSKRSEIQFLINQTDKDFTHFPDPEESDTSTNRTFPVEIHSVSDQDVRRNMAILNKNKHFEDAIIPSDKARKYKHDTEGHTFKEGKIDIVTSHSELTLPHTILACHTSEKKQSSPVGSEKSKLEIKENDEMKTQELLPTYTSSIEGEIDDPMKFNNQESNCNVLVASNSMRKKKSKKKKKKKINFPDDKTLLEDEKVNEENDVEMEDESKNRLIILEKPESVNVYSEQIGTSGIMDSSQAHGEEQTNGRDFSSYNYYLESLDSTSSSTPPTKFQKVETTNWTTLTSGRHICQSELVMLPSSANQGTVSEISFELESHMPRHSKSSNVNTAEVIDIDDNRLAVKEDFDSSPPTSVTKAGENVIVSLSSPLTIEETKERKKRKKRSKKKGGNVGENWETSFHSTDSGSASKLEETQFSVNETDSSVIEEISVHETGFSQFTLDSERASEKKNREEFSDTLSCASSIVDLRTRDCNIDETKEKPEVLQSQDKSEFHHENELSVKIESKKREARDTKDEVSRRKATRKKTNKKHKDSQQARMLFLTEDEKINLTDVPENHKQCTDSEHEKKERKTSENVPDYEVSECITESNRSEHSYPEISSVIEIKTNIETESPSQYSVQPLPDHKMANNFKSASEEISLHQAISSEENPQVSNIADTTIHKNYNKSEINIHSTTINESEKSRYEGDIKNDNYSELSDPILNMKSDVFYKFSQDLESSSLDLIDAKLDETRNLEDKNIDLRQKDFSSKLTHTDLQKEAGEPSFQKRKRKFDKNLNNEDITTVMYEPYQSVISLALRDPVESVVTSTEDGENKNLVSQDVSVPLVPLQVVKKEVENTKFLTSVSDISPEPDNLNFFQKGSTQENELQDKHKEIKSDIGISDQACDTRFMYKNEGNNEEIGLQTDISSLHFQMTDRENVPSSSSGSIMYEYSQPPDAFIDNNIIEEVNKVYVAEESLVVNEENPSICSPLEEKKEFTEMKFDVCSTAGELDKDSNIYLPLTLPATNTVEHQFFFRDSNQTGDMNVFETIPDGNKVINSKCDSSEELRNKHNLELQALNFGANSVLIPQQFEMSNSYFSTTKLREEHHSVDNIHIASYKISDANHENKSENATQRHAIEYSLVREVWPYYLYTEAERNWYMLQQKEQLINTLKLLEDDGQKHVAPSTSESELAEVISNSYSISENELLENTAEMKPKSSVDYYTMELPRYAMSSLLDSERTWKELTALNSISNHGKEYQDTASDIETTQFNDQILLDQLTSQEAYSTHPVNMSENKREDNLQHSLTSYLLEDSSLPKYPISVLLDAEQNWKEATAINLITHDEDVHLSHENLAEFSHTSEDHANNQESHPLLQDAQDQLERNDTKSEVFQNYLILDDSLPKYNTSVLFDAEQNWKETVTFHLTSHDEDEHLVHENIDESNETFNDCATSNDTEPSSQDPQSQTVGKDTKYHVFENHLLLDKSFPKFNTSALFEAERNWKETAVSLMPHEDDHLSHENIGESSDTCEDQGMSKGMQRPLPDIKTQLEMKDTGPLIFENHLRLDDAFPKYNTNALLDAEQNWKETTAFNLAPCDTDKDLAHENIGESSDTYYDHPMDQDTQPLLQDLQSQPEVEDTKHLVFEENILLDDSRPKNNTGVVDAEQNWKVTTVFNLTSHNTDVHLSHKKIKGSGDIFQDMVSSLQDSQMQLDVKDPKHFVYDNHLLLDDSFPQYNTTALFDAERNWKELTSDSENHGADKHSCSEVSTEVNDSCIIDNLQAQMNQELQLPSVPLKDSQSKSEIEDISCHMLASHLLDDSFWTNKWCFDDAECKWQEQHARSVLRSKLQAVPSTPYEAFCSGYIDQDGDHGNHNIPGAPGVVEWQTEDDGVHLLTKKVLASGDLDALQTSLKDCEMRLTSLSSDSLRNMYDDILMICDALKSIDVKAQTLEEIIQQLPTDQDVQNLNVATSNLRRRVTTLLSYTSEGCSTIERIQAQQEQQLQNIAHYEELLNEIASWCSAATVTLNIDLQNLSHQQLLEQRDVFEMISQELDQHDKKLKELMMSNDMQTHAGCLQLGTSLHQQLLSVRNLLMDMDVQVTNQITVTKEPEKTKRAETVEMKEEKSSGYQKLHSINEQECHSASIPGALPVPEKSPEVVEKQPQVEDVEPLLLSPHGLVVSVHDERDNTIDSNASPIADEEVSLPSIEEEQEPAVKKIQEDKIAFHVASQTGDSLREPPPSILPVSTKDVAVEFHQPVDSQVQTMALTTTSAQMTENIPYEQHREKIKILKKFDDHEEVVEIATGHPSERLDISAVEGDRHREIFDDSDDNLMVEVKFKGKKSKEKPILQLVRDPDEMSTEVIVEAERRKRIVLKTSHSGDTEVHVIDDKHLSKDHSPPKDKPSEISPEVKFTMPEKDTSKQKELSDPQDMDLKLSGRETVELDSSPEKGTIEEYQFQSTPDEPLTRSVDEKLDVKEKDLPEYVPEEEKQEKIVHMGIGLAVTEISSTCLNISDIPAENTSVKESEITVYEESEGVPDSSEDVMKLSSLQVINDNNIEPCEGQKLLQEGSQTQEGFSGSPLTKDTDIANEPVTPENVSEEHPDDEYPELSRVKESTALPDTDDISIETSLAESTEIIVSTEGDKNSSDTTKPTELEIVFLDTSCVQSPMEFDSTHSQETGYDPEDISSEVSIPEKKKKRRKKRAKQMSEVPQTVKEPQVQDDIHELTTMTLSRVESIITTDKEENVQTDYQQALQTTTATISAKYIDDPGEETILTNDETDNLKEQDNVEEIMSQTETAEEHNEILDICLHPEVVPQIVMTDSSVQATVSVAVETVQTISPEPSPKEIQSNDFISEIDTQTSPAPETFDMGMQTLSPEFKIQDFQTCATQVSSPESVPEKQESEITHSATQVTTETEEGYMQTSPIEQIISDVADVSLQTVIDTNETLDSFVQTSPVPEVPAPTNIQPEDSNGVHEEQISPELQDHVPYIEKTEEAPLAIGGVTVSSVTETVHSSMQTTDMPTISCESQTSPDGFKDTERMPTATVSMQTNSETVISADSYMQTSPMDSFQMETINASIQTETSNTGNISTQADIVLPSEGITVDIQTNKDELTPSVEMSMQTDIAKLPVTETTDTISQTIQSGSGTMPGSDSCIQTTVSELIPSVEGSTQTNLQPSTFIDSSVQTNKEPSTSEQPLHPEFATSPKEPQTEREKDADKQERNESSSEEQLEVNIQASIVFPTERTTLVAQKTVNKQSSPAPQDDREPTHAEKSLKKRHKKKSKRNDKGSANKKPETTEKLSVADVERFVDIRPSSGREINDLKPQPSEQVPDAKELLTPKRTVDDDAEEIVSKSLDGKDPYSQVHIHDYTKSENASERFERQDVQELVMSLKDNEEISLKQDKPIVIEADNVVYKIEDSVVASVPDSVMKEEDIPLKVEPHSANIDDDVQKVDLIIETQSTKNGNEINIQVPETLSDNVSRNFEIIPSEQSSEKSDLITAEECYRKEICYPKENEWKQMQCLVADRVRKLQKERHTTHLSGVLYLATLQQIVADESFEQKNSAFQDDIITLRDAVDSKDKAVIQRSVITIVETVSTWLESIEYHVLLNCQLRTAPTKDHITELGNLKQEIINVGEKVEGLNSVMENVYTMFDGDDASNMKQCISSLQNQVEAMKEVTDEKEQQATKDLNRWEEFLNGVNNVSVLIEELKEHLDQLVETDLYVHRKLELLDHIESTNHSHQQKTIQLMNNAWALLCDFPGHEIPPELYSAYETTRSIEHSVKLERDRQLQLIALADEYEQTLKEFAQIVDVADALVESSIVVSSLEHLQEEMQKHRKFFVNLSHCRCILESLEGNLDTETRNKHSGLHQQLHTRASGILDKAAGRAQQMALAASRWTVLEQGMKEERNWLQVAHQRVPDLQSVTSSEYNQYISLYQSLSADVAVHHGHCAQLIEVARRLQELVLCPGLEARYDEHLEVIAKLQEDINKNLHCLLSFRDTWRNYVTLTEKLFQWMIYAEKELANISSEDQRPGTNMKHFWELKAQYEVHNNIRNEASSNFNAAMKIIPVADENLQCQLNAKLEERWWNVSSQIQNIQTAILEILSNQEVPVKDKLAALQQELQELQSALNDTHRVIKKEEELELYIQRMQVMLGGVEHIQEELSRLGLLSVDETEKVGILLCGAGNIELQIKEELEGAILLREKINAIQKGLNRIRRSYERASNVLDQCEKGVNQGQDAVEQALRNCQGVCDELTTLWQDVMDLRQLLHTLPMSLHLSISPVHLERNISQVQDHHTALESRSAHLLSLLKNRLTMWQHFEQQLELVQQSVQETDYMMELLTVQGSVDYDRLVKATECLEGLYGSLDQREDLLDELRVAAAPLAESCAPEVSAKIKVAVEDVERSWNNTRQTLRELCERYQDAARLWRQYREASDCVKTWAEQQLDSTAHLTPAEALRHVK